MNQSEKPTKAFILSLAAGILIISNAAALGAAAAWFPGVIPTLPGSTGNDTTLLYHLATVGLICGIAVLIASIMLYIKPTNKKAWGITVIVFSIPSVVTGGGFIIGFILGIIGGAKALRWKPEMPEKKPAT